MTDQTERKLPESDVRSHPECPFCAIVAGTAPATIVRDWDRVIAIEPLHPVVEGHLLVIPKWHSTDFSTEPYTAAAAMLYASMLAGELDRPMNLITSKGAAATQTVFHLHLHLVPRAEGDGLALPWDDHRTIGAVRG